MTCARGMRLLGPSLILVVHSACSRVDIFAVTDEPTLADGQGGQGPSVGGNDAGDHPTATGGGGGDRGSGGDFDASTPVLCPSAGRAAGDTSETVQVGSLSRTFVLHIPPTYDGNKPVPLLLDLHRMGGSGSSQLSSSPYPPITDPEGVVMAFPDGKKGPIGTDWNLGPCCVANVDDVAFLEALVAEVEKTVCIDAGRVYATGATTGGGMVHYLACHAAGVFAAVAPSGFDLLQENVDDCRPSRPISVMSFRGTSESMVPYAGGVSSVVPGMSVTLLGAEETFETWAELDGCTGTPSPKDRNGCSSYTACKNGVEVILCTEDGSRDDARDASIAWPALKRHKL